ncbi:MAG: hypothetical protein SFV23_16100 [Planctomycetaceae bacterium]|nr:hypothetical protein [Planctomycetaceae bacterium]
MSAPTATDCPSEVGPRLHTIGTRWKSDSLWVLAGSIADFLGQGGLFVVLSRLTSPEVVGHFAGALALSSPVFMLSSLQLRSLLLSDVAREYRLGDAAFVRSLTVVIASAISLALAWILGATPALFMALLGIVCFKSSDALAELSVAQFQREGLFKWATYQQLARAAAILVTGTVAAWQFRSASCVALAAATGSLLAASLILYQVRRPGTPRRTSEAGLRPPELTLESLRPRYSPKVLKKLILGGLPLGVVMMLFSLLSSVPRLYLEKTHGSTELGLFAVCGFVSAGAMMVVNAACQPATQRLALLYASGRIREYFRLLGRLMILAGLMGGVLVVGAALFGELVLAKLFGPNYAGQSVVLLWQLASTAVAFVTACLGTAATSAHRFAPQTIVMSIAVATCAIACACLVPIFGAEGAAASSFIASCVCCLGYYWILPARSAVA